MFRSDPAVSIAGLALVLIALAALLAPWIAPFDPAHTLDVSAGAQAPSAMHCRAPPPPFLAFWTAREFPAASHFSPSPWPLSSGRRGEPSPDMPGDGSIR